MGMDGKKILERLGKLSPAEKMKDVKPLSYALFPGYHCPLMGAMLTVNRIRDSVLMVLGPDECSYYTKMATGGSGDVLAGICASLLAQGKAPFDCACAAVYLHGLAGDFAAKRLGKISMLPGDIIDELPNAFAACGV